MKQKIRATLQAMAQQEILAMVNPDTLARIKMEDKSPEFRVYAIGHEGMAKPNVLGGVASKTFRFMKDVVIGIMDKLTFSTPTFHGHGKGTNAHEGREPIGEVVGKTLRKVGDAMSVLAAVYIYPKHRNKVLDIASIEAEMEFYEEEGNEVEVIDVLNISGIALGSSKNEKPAFAGATLLGVVQAFSKGEDKMTVEELKAAAKELKVKVTDLFSKDEILSADPVVQTIEVERGHAKRVEKQLGEEREKVIDLTKQKDEATTKLKGLNEKLSATTGKSLLEASISTRKLGPKAKAFIEKYVDRFKSEKEGEDLKTDFEKFMDAQVKEWEDTCKLMGVDPKTDAPKEEGKKKEEQGGMGSNDGENNNTDELDNPKNNPLIPQEA